MLQHQSEITVATRGQGLYEITRDLTAAVARSGIATGLATVFCRHTSCSLILNENADPDVRHDLEAFFRRLVPDGDPAFIHTSEGPDDMAAHIRTALTSSSVAIPVSDGFPVLGTWQGLYLFEHRTAPHHRRCVIHVSGTPAVQK